MEFIAPFSHMPGPAFLILYGGIFGVLFCISLAVRSRIDASASKEPLAPDVDPDPYRIAYLRGGVNEVLRLATFELFSQGYVGEQSDGFSKAKSSKTKWGLIPSKFDPALVSPIALEVSHFFVSPRKPTEIFQSNVPAHLSDHFRKWDQWIDSENLKIRSEQKSKLVGVALGVSATFFAIGLAKIMIAIANERHNVGFAIAMMVGGSIAIMCTAIANKLSARGRAYLNAIQTINSHHRTLAHLPSSSAGATSDIASNALGSMPMMAMGLFGVAALQASPFDAFRRTYQKSDSSGGGCGAASCAAYIGASCGGGAASCSGGGASCGGGSGCGGCGGGCGGS